MKLFSITNYFIFAFFISSCSYAEQAVSTENNELLKFAKANCFFWYFKKKNYDLTDIRAISGGIVEMGSFSAEKYQNVSILVKGYKPNIKTKQNIDLDLYKCFILESDNEFISKLNKIK